MNGLKFRKQILLLKNFPQIVAVKNRDPATIFIRIPFFVKFPFSFLFEEALLLSILKFFPSSYKAGRRIFRNLMYPYSSISFKNCKNSKEPLQ